MPEIAHIFAPLAVSKTCGLRVSRERICHARNRAMFSALLPLLKGCLAIHSTVLTPRIVMFLSSVSNFLRNAADWSGSRINDSLKAAGMEFIEENGGGPGVRSKKRT